MKNAILTGFITTTILLAGCGKKSSESPTTPQPAQNRDAASAAAQPALTAWQQGDKAAAVSDFVATDWNARPLFAGGSPLNLTEEQFTSLSSADAAPKAQELLAYMVSLKEIAQAVAQKGRDAVASGDTADAQKYFTALKQAGAALQSPDHTLVLQFVGKAFVKMSDPESAKIKQ